MLAATCSEYLPVFQNHDICVDQLLGSVDVVDVDITDRPLALFTYRSREDVYFFGRIQADNTSANSAPATVLTTIHFHCFFNEKTISLSASSCCMFFSPYTFVKSVAYLLKNEKVRYHSTIYHFLINLPSE